jgi:uracil-DNA glycosylase family 4
VRPTTSPRSTPTPSQRAPGRLHVVCTVRGTHAVGVGRSSLQADWMVVGDAPDADDDAAGVPFAGRAGQLARQHAAALRLSRGGAPACQPRYVTPSVKCRPPAGRVPEPPRSSVRAVPGAPGRPRAAAL